MVNTSDLKATTATFIDLNDNEITTSKTQFYQEHLQKQNRKSRYGSLAHRNNVLYIYEGTGAHQVKEYLKDENIVKPALCSVLATFLENSIANEETDELIPISSSIVGKTLEVYADETKNPKDLLNTLDSTLSYGNTPRYTQGESKIRKELDMAYQKLQKTQDLLQLTERWRKEKEQAVNSLINNIRTYSSDTTFYQICVSSKLWQLPAGIDPFSEPSDRQIRETYTNHQNPNANISDNNNNNNSNEKNENLRARK